MSQLPFHAYLRQLDLIKKVRCGYRFCNHKEKVVDLLRRVATMSVKTVRITEAMKGAAR